MKSYTVVAALAATCACASSIGGEDSHTARFNQWKLEHGKVYASVEEEKTRFGVFVRNHEKIEAHNSDASQTFTMGHNKFSDITADEFKSKVGSGFVPNVADAPLPVEESRHTAANPRAMDWRDAGVVTAVRNQETCGSPWAVSVIHTVESANLIKHNGSNTDHNNILSIQQLVDCDKMDSGCQGGFMYQAFSYMMQLGTKGLCTERSYPYEAKDLNCRADSGTPSHIQVTGYVNISDISEAALETAVANIGPVSVAVEADQRVFQFYNGGVITTDCGTRVDHAGAVVGYTDEYWIFQNGWGTDWGEDGFARIGRGSNLCGIISNLMSYPLVA